jgi:hypothetical protein
VKLPNQLWELAEAPLWVALDPNGIPRRASDFQPAIPTQPDDLKPHYVVLDAIRRMEDFNRRRSKYGICDLGYTCALLIAPPRVCITLNWQSVKHSPYLVAVHEWIYNLFPGTYAELRPNSGALKDKACILCEGQIPKSAQILNAGLEICDNYRFAAITGHLLRPYPVTGCQESLDPLFRWIHANAVSYTQIPLEFAPVVI